jgi:hypothetical protein
MDSKPLTKEDIAKLNNWQARLVPIKTYQDARKLQQEVVEKTEVIIPERVVFQEKEQTIVRHALEDLVKGKKCRDGEWKRKK